MEFKKVIIFGAIFLVIYLVKVSIGKSDYIECYPGDLNVILSSPHGGHIKANEIKDRDAGCYVNNTCIWTHSCGEINMEKCRATTVKDSYTSELTKLIAEHLENITGMRPTTVINFLHRSKLDPNRDLEQAAFGEKLAVEAWLDFQGCINESKKTIESNADVLGMGLFIDIHGHGHPNVWAELGYIVRPSVLDSETDIDPKSTSILHLSTKSNVPFDDLLRGNISFGYFLEQEGYESVPSPTNPGPKGQTYFNGGYNTITHGSITGGTIDAIQIESAFKNRQITERGKYAKGLAKAIVKFMQTNYPTMKYVVNSGPKLVFLEKNLCLGILFMVYIIILGYYPLNKLI